MIKKGNEQIKISPKISQIVGFLIGYESFYFRGEFNESKRCEKANEKRND